MSVKFHVSGRTFTTRVESPREVTVFDDEDRTHSVRLDAGPGSSFAVESGSGMHVGYAARVGEQVWVRWRGRTYVVEVDRGRRRAAGGHGDLTAPMPGQVQKHLVATGAVVAPGDPLLVMEAMKMQLEIKAPRAGAVKRFLVAEGEQVAGGAPLVELEDAP